MILLRGLALSACMMLAVSGPTLATRILSWSASPAEIAGGVADGVAISQDGLLFLAPRLTGLGPAGLPGRFPFPLPGIPTWTGYPSWISMSPSSRN